MKRLAFAILVGWGTLAGAQKPRALKIVSDAPAPTINLSLRVAAMVNGVKRAVAPGETLHSGDRIELLLDADVPAYVYVVQFFADGTSAVLFPPKGDLKIEPGASTRLPPAGQWFELDRSVGKEDVLVIAASRPLSEVDKAAHELVEDVRTPRKTRAQTTNKPRPAPVSIGIRARGLMVVDEHDKSLKAKSDGDGVAVFRFTFNHQ